MPNREDPAHTPRFPIRVVAERTGITPATLRAWERRHRAIAPRRSQGAQRLYSEADIERLRMIGELAARGHPLSDLARHATSTLSRLLMVTAPEESIESPEALQAFRASSTVTRMLADTRALDAAALRSTLTQGVFELGPLGALDALFTPFLREVGNAWECGELTIAHEHLASAAVRDVLGWLLQNATHDRKAPVFVASTVSSELHEFGSMMAAVVAAVAGWRVVYLGPNIPASELVRVAKEARAKIVVMGIVNREGVGELRTELQELRDGLGAHAAIVAGGAATDEHRLSLRKARIDLVESRAELKGVLDALWTRA
jgi:methanogenic corrinoid protein MtbC1